MAEFRESQWGPIGFEVYNRTYSRVKQDGSKETWPETVERVVKGNLNYVDAKYTEPGEFEELRDLLLTFKAIPAGRHLWQTGVAGKSFPINCWGNHWWPIFSRHFCFLFERLMEGGGVGANYSNKYLKQYGPIKHALNFHVVCSPTHKDYEKVKPFLSKDYSHEWAGSFPVGDSREGWVEVLGKLVDAVYADEEQTLVVDVSRVRSEGEPIKTFGGTASGPAALVEMLTNITTILRDNINKKPTSLLCMRIDHEIGKCVVSGNVRRSARMSLKHWKDDDIFDFLTCKNIDKDGMARDHWTTNISVVVDNTFFRKLKEKDLHAKRVAKIYAKGALNNGEPGFLNLSKASEGELNEVLTCNPCGEIQFSDPTDSCNLGHVNLAEYVNDQSGYLKACRLMTRFLIRATFSSFPDNEAKQVVSKNRRIGVGFFGFHDWLVMNKIKFSEAYESQSVRKFLRKAKEVIRKEARDFAFTLRIPEPIKVTCVAPTGSIAKLPGTTEGCQSILYLYMIRRVNFSTVDKSQQESLAKFLAEGYPIEDSLYTTNTKVVSFHVKDPLVEKAEKAGIPTEYIESAIDIDMEDMMAVQAMIQEEYADNAISFTINFDKTKYTTGQIIRAMKTWGPRLKGTTMMPIISNRPQMPYERITKEEYEAAKNRSISQIDLDCINGCPIR